MAYFIRETGSSLTPLQHSYNIFHEYLTDTFFKNLIGSRDSGKPIILDGKQLFGKKIGDVARYHFTPQYKGKGIYGQNPSITGNEKSIEEFYMDLRVDQVAQAFAKKGKLTDMRTILDYRDEFKRQLVEWFRQEIETDLVAALTGIITDGVTKIADGDLMSTPLVTGEGRCFRPDYASNKFSTVSVSAADSTGTALLTDITAADTMNTYLLDELQHYAKWAGKYAMKPIRLTNGEEYYMLVLHPQAVLDLQRDPRWEKRVNTLWTGKASLDGDPIATGTLGVWGRLILKEAEHIVTQTNGTKTIARNLLLGANAAVIAYAQNLDYKEEERDYKRVMGVAADEIRGVKKLQFNNTDMNVAQVPCYITPIG